MSNLRHPKTPSYRLHKPSGQAVVTLNGRDVYLGPHGSKASREQYERLIGEWLINGRRVPIAEDQATPDDGFTITELMAAYICFAKEYYVKDGRPTGHMGKIKEAVKPLKELYGRTAAAQFGPLALKSVRQKMIDKGLCRSVINSYTGILKQMFKWGVENELVPAHVFHGLTAVSGLRKGRCGVREADPVRPVPDAAVEAIRPHVSPQVWAMIELQKLTGMRSGELVIMRGCDLDVTGDLWIYRPSSHKTDHHGHDRTVELGPRARQIVSPFLKLDPKAYLFSPKEAEARRNEERRRQRKSPMTPSQSKRQKKRRPLRVPAEHYTTDSYRRAIARACEKAGIPSWHPHQLRHSFGTRIRKHFGLETAKAMLGHRTVAATQVYAEMDRAKAEEVAAKVG